MHYMVVNENHLRLGKLNSKLIVKAHFQSPFHTHTLSGMRVWRYKVPHSSKEAVLEE